MGNGALLCALFLVDSGLVDWLSVHWWYRLESTCRHKAYNTIRKNFITQERKQYNYDVDIANKLYLYQEGELACT